MMIEDLTAKRAAKARTIGAIAIDGALADTSWLRSQIAAQPRTGSIRVNINGHGDPERGLAYYNILRAAGRRVEVTIDGTAAGGAAIVAMAGDHIRMPANGFLLLSQPIAPRRDRTAKVHRAVADRLDRILTAMVGVFAARTKLPDARVRELLPDGGGPTLLTAAQAVEMGFADSVTKPMKAVARINVDGATVAEEPVERFHDRIWRAWNRRHGVGQ